jgi:dTDP-glucose 4,6-dehydratase
LVTGGAGFIGSNFVRHVLKGTGTGVDRVINLDKLTYAGNPANLKDLEDGGNYTFVQGDIADERLVADLLQKHQIGAVVNFAAESHVDRSIDSPEPFFQTNVIGTLRLVEACRHFWKNLQGSDAANFRFVHVSTDEVYGSLAPEDPAFTEETPFAPNSPYAASKAGSDHVVRAAFHTHGFPAVTTNCSNNYGPYQFPEKLIPLVLLNALEGKKLPIYGDGSNIRDWLFVGDHCRAIAEVLRRGRLGETYNVGGDSEKTNLQMVDRICGVLDELRPRPDGSLYASLKTFVADRPGHDRRYAIDFSKIHSELGWAPEETFDSGLAKTVRWYLENQEWCEDIRVTRYQGQRLGTGVPK